RNNSVIFPYSTFTDINVVALPAAGTYTLTVQSNSGTGVGTYSFSILDATPQTFPVNIGDSVALNNPSTGAGNLEVIGSKDLYTFSGTAGQVLDFKALTSNLSPNDLVWRLTDHNNSVIFPFTTFTDVNVISLSTTDTYTLTLQSNNGNGVGT